MASSRLSPEAQARWAVGVMLFFMLFGGLIAFFGYRDVARASASQNWPTAKGTVLESRVTFTPAGGTVGDEVSSGAVWFRYSYKVGKAEYEGFRIAYGKEGSGAYPHAREFMAKYPEGGEITVRYMPDNPAECVIEPGLNIQLWAQPGFGALFFVVGCIGLVILPKLIREKSD
jgi:hypothetical protein